jgi:hypothetical protein
MKKSEKSEDSEEDEEEEIEEENEESAAQSDDSDFFQQGQFIDFHVPVLERVASSPRQLANLEDFLPSATEEKNIEDGLKYSAVQTPETGQYETGTSQNMNIVLTPIENADRNINSRWNEMNFINSELQNLMQENRKEDYLRTERIEKDERLPGQEERKYRRINLNQ